MQMENSEVYSDNKSEGMYSKLICQDDNEFITTGQPPHTSPETQHQVSVFTVRDRSSSHAYRLATWGLGILCAVLLAAIIALCASYKELSEKHLIHSQNSSEIGRNLEQLQANYSMLIAAKAQLKSDYNMALSAKEVVERERDRERQEKERLQRARENLETTTTELQERILHLEKSCEGCPPGWELFRSTCYFFATAGSGQQLSWSLSREECKKSDADLAIIDTQEKQEFISRILKIKGRSSIAWHTTGYWIGLRDIQTEGVWKWLNGTELTTGYWFEGEPNDYYEAEDCAATYPKENPLKTWNDAPCGFKLNWICEKAMKE